MFFSREWFFLPQWENCAYTHAVLLITKYQQSDWKSNTVVFRNLTWCLHSNNGGKKDIVQKASPMFQINKEHPCVFLTRARQVSNSWYTQNGFFQHERKGKVKWCCHHCWKAILLKTLFWSKFTRATKPAHELSFGKSKDWIKIVLDFQTNNNIKRRCYDQFHLASEYWFHKSSKISEPGLHPHQDTTHRAHS